MPLKLNVGASRKMTDNNYGSRGASANLEIELDSALVMEPAKLQEKIRQLFSLVRVSLAEELNGNGHANGQSAPAPNGHHSSTGQQSRNGHGPRPATASQVKALHAIARNQDIALAPFLSERFGVHRAEELSIKQASQAIDDLKSAGVGQGV